ncbi:hypothetical protein P9112_014602 [Eukaryota sp. TZLM1-RC]
MGSEAGLNEPVILFLLSATDHKPVLDTPFNDLQLERIGQGSLWCADARYIETTVVARFDTACPLQYQIKHNFHVLVDPKATLVDKFIAAGDYLDYFGKVHAYEPITRVLTDLMFGVSYESKRVVLSKSDLPRLVSSFDLLFHHEQYHYCSVMLFVLDDFASEVNPRKILTVILHFPFEIFPFSQNLDLLVKFLFTPYNNQSISPTDLYRLLCRKVLTDRPELIHLVCLSPKLSQHIPFFSSLFCQELPNFILRVAAFVQSWPDVRIRIERAITSVARESSPFSVFNTPLIPQWFEGWESSEVIKSFESCLPSFPLNPKDLEVFVNPLWKAGWRVLQFNAQNSHSKYHVLQKLFLDFRLRLIGDKLSLKDINFLFLNETRILDNLSVFDWVDTDEISVLIGAQVENFRKIEDDLKKFKYLSPHFGHPKEEEAIQQCLDGLCFFNCSPCEFNFDLHCSGTSTVCQQFKYVFGMDDSFLELLVSLVDTILFNHFRPREFNEHWFFEFQHRLTQFVSNLNGSVPLQYLDPLKTPRFKETFCHELQLLSLVDKNGVLGGLTDQLRRFSFYFYFDGLFSLIRSIQSVQFFLNVEIPHDLVGSLNDITSSTSLVDYYDYTSFLLDVVGLGDHELEVPFAVAISGPLAKSGFLMEHMRLMTSEEVDAFLNAGTACLSFSSVKTRNFLLQQFKDDESLSKTVLFPFFVEQLPLTLTEFFHELQTYASDKGISQQSIIWEFADLFSTVVGCADSVEELMSASFNETEQLVSLIVGSQLVGAEVELDLFHFEVSLRIPQGGVYINPKAFSVVSSNIIVKYGHSAAGTEDDLYSNNTSFHHFIHLYTLVTELFSTLRSLVDNGYIFESGLWIIEIAELGDLTHLQSAVESQKTLLKRWCSLVGRCQLAIECAGLSGADLRDYLIGKNIEKFNVINSKLPPLDFNSECNLQYPPLEGPEVDNLIGRLEEFSTGLNIGKANHGLVSGPDQIISIIKSESVSSLFIDALHVASFANVTPSISTFLLCSEETSIDSIRAFIAGCATKCGILVGPEYLSFSAKDYLNALTESEFTNIQLFIITTSETMKLNGQKLTVPPIFDSYQSKISEILFSQNPGNGKTSRAKEKCGDNSVMLSGSISIEDTIIKMQYLNRSNKHAIHIDLNKPLDVLKGEWNPDLYTRNSDQLPVRKDFYNLLCILFSLSYLGGIRINGTTLLSDATIYLEIPSPCQWDLFDGVFWAEVLCKSVDPDKWNSKKELVYHDVDACPFSNDSMNLSYTLDKARQYLVTYFDMPFCEHVNSLHCLFTIEVPGFASIDSSRISYKKLSDLACVFVSQISRFEICEFYKTENLECYLGLTSDVIIDLQKQLRLMLLGSCRHLVFLNSLPHHFESPLFFMTNCRGDPYLFIPPSIITTLSYQLQMFYSQIKIQYPSTEMERLEEIVSFADLPRFLSQKIMDSVSNFVLTEAVFVKTFFVLMKLKYNLPVIIKGASGVGKTSFFTHFASILLNDRIDDLFRQISFTAHTPVSVLFETINEINHLARDQSDRYHVDRSNTQADNCGLSGVAIPQPLPDESHAFPILFLDDINASEHFGMVCSLITNRRIDGLALDPSVRLVATMTSHNPNPNPIPNQMGDDNQVFNNISPSTASLQSITIDFGSLSTNDQKQYIECLLKNLKLNSLDVRRISHSICGIHHVLCNSPETNIIVSINYVKTVKKVIEGLWFLLQRGFAAFGITGMCTSLVVAIALYVCYAVRVPLGATRSLINHTINSVFRIHHSRPTISFVQEVMSRFAHSIPKPDHVEIFFTNLLIENLFVMVVGIVCRTPIIFSGDPCQSRTFALNFLINYLCQPSRDPALPKVHPISFQGSDTTTADSLMNAIGCACQQDENENLVSCFVVSEMSLMINATTKPLEVLCDFLERSDESLAFIGICSFSFYRPPSSRTLTIQRSSPVPQTLVSYLELFFNHHPSIEMFVEMYFNLAENSVIQSELGREKQLLCFRDVVSLAMGVPGLGGFCIDDCFPFFIRNYGVFSLLGNSPYGEIYRQWHHKFFGHHLSDAHMQSSMKRAIFDNISDETPFSRHLMLIGPMALVRYILNNHPRSQDARELPCSSYDVDNHKEFLHIHLAKIIEFASTGKIILLPSHQELLCAMFNLFDKNEFRINGDGLGRSEIAIDSVGRTVNIHKATRFIVVCSSCDLVKLPTALLYKFEKIDLSCFGRPFENSELQLGNDLCNSIGFNHINAFNHKVFVPELLSVEGKGKLIQIISHHQVPFVCASQLFEAQELILECCCDTEYGGFLSLEQVVEHHMKLHNNPYLPNRIIIHSNYLGSIPSKVAHYSKVKEFSFNFVNSYDDLVQLVSTADEITDANSLLIFVMKNNQFRHYPMLANFLSNHYIHCDAVIAVIDGKDYILSPLDSFSSYYCDAIGYENPLLDSASDVTTFGFNCLPADVVFRIIQELLPNLDFPDETFKSVMFSTCKSFINTFTHCEEHFQTLCELFCDLIVEDNSKITHTFSVCNRHIDELFCLQDFIYRGVRCYLSDALKKKGYLISRALDLISSSHKLCPLNDFPKIFNSDISLSEDSECLNFENRISELVEFGLSFRRTSFSFINFISRILHFTENTEVYSEIDWDRLPYPVRKYFELFEKWQL